MELPLETLAGRRRLDGKTERLQQVDSPSLPTVDNVFQSIKLLQHFIKHQTSDRSDIPIAIVEGIEGKDPEASDGFIDLHRRNAEQGGRQATAIHRDPDPTAEAPCLLQALDGGTCRRAGPALSART